MQLVAYVSTNGVCPYEKWFDSLNPQAAIRVKKATDRMEEGNFGDHHGVGEGVLERRLDFGPGYRIYFGRDGEALVLLLGGGTKTRQDRDIKRAKEAWQEYKARKKESQQ